MNALQQSETLLLCMYGIRTRGTRIFLCRKYGMPQIGIWPLDGAGTASATTVGLRSPTRTGLGTILSLLEGLLKMTNCLIVLKAASCIVELMYCLVVFEIRFQILICLAIDKELILLW